MQNLPARPRQYSTKTKSAQEAHAAAHPTDFGRDRACSGNHASLYERIWKRALASQMASARLERTTIELADDNGKAGLRATGQVVIFPGFLTLYQESFDDPEDEDSKRLPKMAQGDRPDLGEVKAEQHFTQPPPRYSEASLVKKLEELGIGRPSTYASTLQRSEEHTSALMEKNRFIPEEKGRLRSEEHTSELQSLM